MELDKSLTTAEIAKITENLKNQYVQSDDHIKNAAEIMAYGIEMSGQAIKELSSVMVFNGNEKEVASLTKLIAATYLTAVAEIIKDKQNRSLLTQKQTAQCQK